MSKNHETIEIPAAFSADCEDCQIACDQQQERQCIRTQTAYLEGYKAAMRKREEYKHLVTHIVVYNQVTERDEEFFFMGTFEIADGTRFSLDTKSGRYFNEGKSVLLTDATVRDRLRFCALKKFEVQVTDTPVLGKGGEIRLISPVDGRVATTPRNISVNKT